MNHLLHPLRTYTEWKQRQRNKCVVTIDNPPTRIKGKSYVNGTDDPDFPTFVAFFGIPYATPPVGDLRFQPPQPLQATRSQRRPPLIKAYKTGHASLQYRLRGNGFCGSEDCLYLNIYMLNKPEDTPGNLPVLVYIHGGGFSHGSGDIIHVEPDAIVRQNVIFVTVNYRLGLLGFLNMGTPDCRGNAGLKDQVQALKWIRANIDRFGGDPYNVTLTGHSAGATCVNLHMISPLSKGLFKRAIVKGGGIHCPWGYQGIQNLPRKLLTLEYGLENEMRFALVQILRKENPLGLMEVSERLVNNIVSIRPKRMSIVCGPSKEMIPTGAFIPCDVDELMAKAEPVPLMAGMAAQEGYMYILGKWSRNLSFRTLITNDLHFIQLLRDNFAWSFETANRLKDRLRAIYFSNLSQCSSQHIQDQLATFCTDIIFRQFYDNFRIGQSTKPFFVYKFYYIPQQEQLRWTRCRTKRLFLRAPTHGDELNYLYGPTYLKYVSGGIIPPEMRHVMDHMCSMWGNFCRNGIPMSEVEPDMIWRPHTENRPYYLNINSRSCLIPRRLCGTRWRELNRIVDAEPRELSPALSSEEEELDLW